MITAMLFASLMGHAYAQTSDAAKDYPNRPLRIIVGFTPGGGPDIIARFVAQKLTESWKQQVIVDNRPGAGGTVGANLVANANPDGYTLLSVSSAHAVAAAIYAKLPYHTQKDLAGITQTATSKYLLVVAPSLGVKSVKDLIALAKAKPGQLNFSSAGVGSGTHFAAEQFKALAGINVVHVPYKGIPEALTETLAGRVQYFMAPIANSVSLVKEGKLLGLGVSSPRRDALVPDVPTIAEAGVAGYQSELWFGLLTSSQAPKAIVALLNGELRRILSEPDVKQRWMSIGLEPRPTTPVEFDRLVAGDIELFTKIARAGNIRAE
ncbi:MAG TPA: tripartite tricarboxylate transporter substrate binding protein [Burkholderiales bacterium]|nr:tripartite tricarboxylate transporter substrate binding protein [Burkholderiales bacterium]